MTASIPAPFNSVPFPNPNLTLYELPNTGCLFSFGKIELSPRNYGINSRNALVSLIQGLESPISSATNPVYGRNESTEYWMMEYVVNSPIGERSNITAELDSPFGKAAIVTFSCPTQIFPRWREVARQTL